MTDDIPEYGKSVLPEFYPATWSQLVRCAGWWCIAHAEGGRDVTIRDAVQEDGDAIRAMLRPVFRAGESFPIDRAISREATLAYWFSPERQVLVAEDGAALGTCHVAPNQAGGGRYLCNCGFVTAPAAQNRGVARAMLARALQTATATGFEAMQFDFVVETDAPALRLWRRAGFDGVGRLPEAFKHPVHGRVDARVMYRNLDARQAQRVVRTPDSA
jgi:GNAT superfamily N-acetyltransferase